MRHPDVRVLTLEERILLAKRFIDKKDVLQALAGGAAAVLKDPARVHNLIEVLGKYKIPVLSTELTKEDCELLYDRNGEHPKLVLDYLGTLDDKSGQSLQRLFNIGKFTSLTRPNVRPMSTIRLTVPKQYAAQLERLHREWYESGICIMVHGPEGSYWTTPSTPIPDSDSQRYVIAPADDRTPNRPLSMETEVANLGSFISWEVQVDEYLIKHPALSYLRGYIERLLLPRSSKLSSDGDAAKGALLWSRDSSKTLRVVGITQQGLLLLTEALHQDLIFESQLSFIEALETGHFEVK